MTKYLLAFLVSALALVGAWGWQGQNAAKEARTRADQYQRSYEAEKLAREAVIKQAQVDEEVLLARVAQAEARKPTIKKVDREVKDAVKANPEWASAPVPDGVRAALTSAGLVPKGVPSSPAPPAVP
jgi:uncharacterized protein HemX